MKKIFRYLALGVLGSAFASCASLDDITFDHEIQAFESRDGKILIEAIMPQASAADEEIYIIGEFNGGEEAAFKNPAYLMERSDKIPQKWGIYLDPSTFVAGKTLADGFTFKSVQSGLERSPLNEDVLHTLNIGPGEWANVYVDKWAKYFEKAPEDDVVDHDGYAVFVKNGTGWDAIALYIWGTSEVFGSWPGALPTGTQVLGGEEWVYWDLGKANEGNTCNFIFNNNNGGIQLENFDCLKGQTADKDYYFILTPDGVEPYEYVPSIPHDGHVVYMENRTTWEEVSLYVWGTSEIFGSWPGALPTGTFKVKGVEMLYWDLGEANEGNTCNFIFNNNNGGKQIEKFDCLAGQTADKDYYFTITDDAAYIFGEAPEEGGEDPDNPEPPAPAKATYHIYVDNQTTWDVLQIYSWCNGEAEAFGGWPGSAGETVTIGGKAWRVYTTVEVTEGCGYNLIMNNKVDDVGVQYDALSGNWTGDLFLRVSDTEAVAVEAPKVRLYIDSNTTGWEATAVYAWGSAEVFGGWPGKVLGSEEYIEISSEQFGFNENLIFNNNNGGVQLSDLNLVLNKDYHIAVKAEGASVVE